MVLVGFSFGDVLIGMLWVSLVILVVYIFYKWLLNRMSKDAIQHQDYCVLSIIEKNPASGEIVFYFTSNEIKTVRIVILDSQMNDFLEVSNDECSKGGNIVRFDSTRIPNGEYFYGLITDNQKNVKKMTVING